MDLHSSQSFLYGLPQRIVAAESLVFLAEQFDFLLPYLKQLIPADRHSFLNQFYSQTVQVAQELRIPIYHNVSANVIDYMSIALMISKVNWDIEQILTQHNAYVDNLIQQLQHFREQFEKIQQEILPIPKAVYRTLWDQIFDKIFYTMVEGWEKGEERESGGTTSLLMEFRYASVKKCSIPGRALMQLDFEQFLRKLDRLISDIR